MFEVKKYGEGIFTDKTKIYFCAHPDDLCFFEEISDDILDALDCSVFYDLYDEKDLVEREFDLLQMQLFVVPVTEKLLSSPSKAVDFDLKLARAKHIPVLPIMCDKGLSALFSDKFGSFQYLDRNSEDKTEIDYKSKLRAFLSDLVVSEEGFMSVLSVFRAMIFLSYRKKDRLKAQELIKRIHEIDEMYDVGIWYDEFLKAGEDFNEQIDMFLQGSDLFVLAVTPSLLEKGNYVERVEYPQAKEYDKKILPVVLTPTDSETLSERYEGIVTPIDIRAPLFNEKIKEYIYAVGVLHDIGRWQEYEEGIRHEIASVKLAGPILADCGFEEQEIREILLAISNHRNKDIKEENTLSGWIYQADKKSRSCFSCEAEKLCNWSIEKKNLKLT